MKSILKVAAMIVLFSIAGVSAAIAGTKIVVVTNNTSYTMTNFYASASDAANWDTTNDLLALLGLGSVLPGQQTTIDLGILGDGDCTYDLMAVLSGTTQAAYTYHVDACDGGSWSITGL
jgi:hypothetical protein